MGQVVTDIQIVGGKIRVFYGKCCWTDLEPVQLDGVGGTEIPEETIDDILPPGMEKSPCGAAAAITDLIALVADAFWDERVNPGVFAWIGNVEDAVNLPLSNNYVLNGIFGMQALDLAGATQADIFDPTKMQRVRSKLRDRIGADENGLVIPDTRDIGMIYYDVFGAALYVPWAAAAEALGHKNLVNAARVGQLTQDADCDEPGAGANEWFEGLAPLATWRHSFNFTIGENGFALYSIDTNNPTRYTAGQGYWAKPSTSNSRTRVGCRRAFDAINVGSVITHMGLIFQSRGNENWRQNDQKLGPTTGYLNQFANMIAVTGNNPAASGIYQIDMPCYIACGASQTIFECAIDAEHLPHPPQSPDVITSSSVIIGLFVAGTGPDIFT